MEVNSISDYLKPNMPLPQYLPYARFLLDTDLSHTAKLLYLQHRRQPIPQPEAADRHHQPDTGRDTTPTGYRPCPHL